MATTHRGSYDAARMHGQAMPSNKSPCRRQRRPEIQVQHEVGDRRSLAPQLGRVVMQPAQNWLQACTAHGGSQMTKAQAHGWLPSSPRPPATHLRRSRAASGPGRGSGRGQRCVQAAHDGCGVEAEAGPGLPGRGAGQLLEGRCSPCRRRCTSCRPLVGQEHVWEAMSCIAGAVVRWGTADRHVSAKPQAGQGGARLFPACRRYILLAQQSSAGGCMHAEGGLGTGALPAAECRGSRACSSQCPAFPPLQAWLEHCSPCPGNDQASGQPRRGAGSQATAQSAQHSRA